jgi:hypothetical protein
VEQVSGGSYNYLYLNAPDLGGYRSHLEVMAERLEGLPYATEAAVATRLILTALDDKALADVWHAVEWWDSGDIGEDQVREALAEYQQGKPKRQPGGTSG